MIRRVRLVVVCASLAAVLVMPNAAHGQISSLSPTVAVNNGQPVPIRTVGGQVQPPRVSTLNPTGVNYADCSQDMTLTFNVLVSNFDGSQLLQVWAGTSDCTSDVARGIGMAPTCWPVVAEMSGIRASGAVAPEAVSVRVQDIVSHLESSPTTNSYQVAGPAVCTPPGLVDTAQSVTLYFLATDAAGHAIGQSTGYQYQVKTDLVGPPPPANVVVRGAETLLQVSWTANSDADTAGYALYIDPIPGQAGQILVAGQDAQIQFDCPDVGASTNVGGDGASDAMAEASGDASGASSAPGGDATCVGYGPAGGGASSAGAGNCSSSILWGGASSIVTDASAPQALPTSLQTDEAGNIIDAGATTTSSAGAGISTISSQNLVAFNSATGGTVSGISTATYTIKGLTNGVLYNVAVSAVDASGNIGPASTASSTSCDSPAPVEDFWKVYRSAGGGAGGGFCALEAAGMPVESTVAFAGVGAAAIALVRRRRRLR